jgi:hypothetical protein
MYGRQDRQAHTKLDYSEVIPDGLRDQSQTPTSGNRLWVASTGGRNRPSNWPSDEVTRSASRLDLVSRLTALSTDVLGRTVVGPGSIRSVTGVVGSTPSSDWSINPRTMPRSLTTGNSTGPESFIRRLIAPTVSVALTADKFPSRQSITTVRKLPSGRAAGNPYASQSIFPGM